MQTKLLRITNVDFNVIGRRLIKFLSSTGEKVGAVHQLFIDFKKAYDSVRRKVLYNILNELGIPRELVGLIKMCLNETYSTVRTGKNVSDKFPIQNCLKQGDALSPSPIQYGLELLMTISNYS
jgi:hypothetical protein